MGICPECGREHNRSKTGLCGRCAARKYRATPEGRQKQREANSRAQKKWWNSLSSEEKWAYTQKRRAKTRGQEPPEHGPSGYDWYGCRCEICREGARAKKRRERARKRVELRGVTTIGELASRLRKRSGDGRR